MDTCKSDLIDHLEFQENPSLYILNKLRHEKCFCTIFTHSFVFKYKLVRKYRTSAPSMKKSIFHTLVSFIS